MWGEEEGGVFSDLMSAEDNRVADEGDTLHFLEVRRRTRALSFRNTTPPPYYWNVIRLLL